MAQKANKIKFSQKTVTLKKGNIHTASIIWMHGLGDTAHGWSDAMSVLQQKLPHIQCILPTGPSIAITFQGGMKTTAWHDIEDLQNLQNNTFKYKEESRQLINNLIDIEIKQKGIDPSRIILGGFSQGAAMAIYCGLQYGQRLGGIVSLSGYLCDMNIVKAVNDANIKRIPIIMYHGKNDMIVQTQYGRLSAMLLKGNGFNDTEWEEFDIPMQMNFGHNVIQQELTKVVQFVSAKLPKEFKAKKKEEIKDNVEEKKDDESEENNKKDKQSNKNDNNDNAEQIGPALD